MTELVLSCPRFTRNLIGKRASLILYLSQIPMPAVHWSAIGLGDMGRHCLTLHVTHWAKLSRGQAGQLLDKIGSSHFSLGNNLSGIRIFG